jgi:hypothetical protein
MFVNFPQIGSRMGQEGLGLGGPKAGQEHGRGSPWHCCGQASGRAEGPEPGPGPIGSRVDRPVNCCPGLGTDGGWGPLQAMVGPQALGRGRHRAVSRPGAQWRAWNTGARPIRSWVDRPVNCCPGLGSDGAWRGPRKPQVRCCEVGGLSAAVGGSIGPGTASIRQEVQWCRGCQLSGHWHRCRLYTALAPAAWPPRCPAPAALIKGAGGAAGSCAWGRACSNGQTQSQVDNSCQPKVDKGCQLWVRALGGQSPRPHQLPNPPPPGPPSIASTSTQKQAATRMQRLHAPHPRLRPRP